MVPAPGGDRWQRTPLRLGRVAQGDRRWTLLRSLKRLLKRAGPTTQLDLGGCTMPVIELATEMLSPPQARETAGAAEDQRRKSSSLRASDDPRR